MPDRYEELRTLLLRGEYMTDAEMKEFARLWQRRQMSFRFTATVVGVVAASIVGLASAAAKAASTQSVGEATCGFFDRPKRD